MRTSILTCVIAGLMATPLMAQEEGASEAEGASGGPQEMEPMEVFGERIFRNRTEDINPVLEYDQAFFQRFEPASAGEMLKRLPGVSFANDVGEFQTPQLRGLPAGYTQILINGERLPGASNNRSPLVDRIPFELVERVEIVRSPGADIDSQGTGGTINIVLKEPAEFDGLSLTVGGEYARALENQRNATNSDTNGRASLRYGGDAGPMDYVISANFSERYNPKLQDTSVFEPGVGAGKGPGGFGLVEFASQADTRDTEDASLHFNSDIDFGGAATYTLDAFFIDTDRTETEDELVFERGFGGFDGPFGSNFRDDEVNVDVDRLRAGAQPIEQALQEEDVEQEQWGVSAGVERPLTSAIDLEASLSVRDFNEERREDEVAREFDENGAVVASETAAEELDIDNRNDSGKVGFTQELDAAQTLEYGVSGRLKERDSGFRVFEGGTQLVDQAFEIEEDVYGVYGSHTLEVNNQLTLEHGLRAELTELETQGAGRGASDDDYTEVNPSLSYQYNVSGSDRLRFSVARTLRRPDFNELEPFVVTEEPGDEEAITGDPALDPQTAWGIDLGWERTFARGEGIGGVNVFYRDISDVIDLVDTGTTVTRGGDSFDLFQFRNVGDGEVYGIEGDISAPLTAIGLDRTAVFANGTITETEVEDPLTGGTREFTRSPEWVANIGFNQSFGRGWTVGASVQGKGDLTDTEAAEITEEEIDPFLEAFIEKRFMGEDLVVRLAGANLLDRARTENKRNFASIEDRLANNPEDREIESEQRGRLFRLVVRYQF